MDPLGNFPDEDIWRALANSHLKTFVSSLSEGKYFYQVEGATFGGRGTSTYCIKVGATRGNFVTVPVDDLT